ncbi:hypothetical protein FSP39_011599 [Pinctada imbricata]|uniref:Coiled-coil domain-containing protein 151 n=1 Tax=Pinctada imbricata TaxID=66713 RepID=A0AA88Y282_PINIB|nr:hypothetical protein FSP39_011599 [Pinctada imbricata]
MQDPGKSTNPKNSWSLMEQIEELRGKIHLKERDAKAYYEAAEARKIVNEDLVAKLRAENKAKRIQLAGSINEAVNTMDQKSCEANKRLNDLQYARLQRENRLNEMTAYLSRERRNDSFDKDFERKRDCRTYPTRLDNLEETVKEAKKELELLKLMNEKAVTSSEDQRRELHTMEREMYQAKRTRDQQLNETKKEVERRKEPNERAEKRPKVTILTDNTELKIAKLQIEKLERHEKILTLDEGFEKIKNAIDVSDMEDIVFRVVNQDHTRDRIRHQEKEKLQAKARLLEEREKLIKVFEEMKFTSQRQIAKGRRLVDEMEEYVKEEETNCREALANMRANEKLLLDLQSGITTLFEKLKDVKLKPPNHNYSRGDPVDDLASCARKLDTLLKELGLSEDVNINKKIQMMDRHKLHEYLEGRLPQENIRIKVEADDGSDEDDFHFDHDQDNEGLMSREDIKKHGQDLLNAKLKPKRKKSRKTKKQLVAYFNVLII